MKSLLPCILLAAVAFAVTPAQAERICLSGSAGFDLKVVDGKNVVLQPKTGTQALKLTTSCTGLAVTDTIRLNGASNCVSSDEFLVDKTADGKSDVCQIVKIHRIESPAQ